MCLRVEDVHGRKARWGWRDQIIQRFRKLEFKAGGTRSMCNMAFFVANVTTVTGSLRVLKQTKCLRTFNLSRRR